MKPELMLELLEDVASKMNVRVSYEPLQASVGNGGLCRVKDQYRVIVDKRATADERITILAQALATFDIAAVPMTDKVRTVIRQNEGSGRKRRAAA